MEDKTFAQMKSEMAALWNGQIKDSLPKYNIERKKSIPVLFFAITGGIAFMLVFILGPLGDIKGMPIILFFLVVYSIVAIKLSSWLSKKLNINNSDIEADAELKLKNKFMLQFLQIFLTRPTWAKGQDTDNKELFEYMKNKKGDNILNRMVYSQIDDIVRGFYKGVDIRILEIKGNPINLTSIIQMIICTFLFVCCGGGCLIGIIFVIFTFGACFLHFTYGQVGDYIIIGIASFLAILIGISVLIQLMAQFKGIVIEIDMNKKVTGHTFFIEKAITSKNIPINMKGFQSVKLEHSTFAQNYNIYSTNQVEARYILTPSFMERIKALDFAFKAKCVRGSFRGNQLTLVIHTNKDLFSMGSLLRNSTIKDFEILYDEMISVLQIVDELKLNEHTGL